MKEEDFYKMPARERYYRDPCFHALVDQMGKFIEQAKYTPSEMREAAILAGIIYEERQTRMIYPGPIREGGG